MRFQGKQSYARTLLAVVCLLGVVLGWTQPVRANDTAVRGVGGSWQPLKGEHPSIRMVSERVAIEIYHDYYLVTADFVFHNSGRAITVAMGFPEGGGGDIGGAEDARYYAQHSQFDTFRTLVDGKPTSVRRTFLGLKDESYDALWVKHVHFRREQTRRVRVHYKANQGHDTGGGQFVIYDFTGGNWRGDVAASDLTVRFRTPGTYIYNSTLDLPTEKGDSITQKNVLKQANKDVFFMRRTHWQAQGYFNCRYIESLPNWLGENAMNTSDLRLDGEKASILTVPLKTGKSVDGKYFNDLPIGVKIGQTTFVNLQLLDKRQVNLTWDMRDHSLLLSTPYRRLRYWAHKAYARSETGQFVPLSAELFRLDSQWYVPLQPVLDALDATAEVKPQQHLLRIHYPKS